MIPALTHRILGWRSREYLLAGGSEPMPVSHGGGAELLLGTIVGEGELAWGPFTEKVAGELPTKTVTPNIIAVMPPPTRDTTTGKTIMSFPVRSLDATS
jgi:hypothetical protein